MTYKFLEKYPYLTPLSVTSTESRLISDSINLKRKSVRKNAQRFDFTITLTEAANANLHADLMGLWFTYGMETPFLIDVPQPLYTDKLTIGSGITVSGSHAAGASVVNIVGSSFSIPAGRFITFSGSTKLYVVKEAVQGSSAALKISPALTTSIASGASVAINGVKASVLNEADNAVFSYESGIIQTATLKFIENV